jgi:hypothetical protein
MNGRPVKRPRQSFYENHGIVVGATRSGKTSRFLSRLTAQLLQPYRGDDGEVHRDVVVCFDFGGDNGWYWTWHSAAEDRKKYTFSTDPEESGYFDPFQSAAGNTSLQQLSVGISAALSISASLNYGPLYFFMCAANWLRVGQTILRRMGLPATAKNLLDVMDPRRKLAPRLKDSEMIRMSFELLNCYEQLSVPADAKPEEVINFDRILEEESTCYFHALLTGENSVRQIVGLALFCLIQSAIMRARAGKPKRNVFVFLDEFHAVVGESFAELIVMAAKFGIYFIGMALQTLGQLKHSDVEFSEIVLNNANLQVFFTAFTEAEHKYISFQSRDVPVRFEGGVERGLVTERSYREMLAPAVDSNLIRDVSGTAGDALLIIRDGKGHKDPLRIHCPFIQGEDVYRELKERPLPRRELPAPPPKAPPKDEPSPQWTLAPKDAEHRARLERMEAFMRALVAEYQGK